jgi:hypothetical protein
MKTLPETFYKKNSDLHKKLCQFLKKPNKTQKTRLEVGFFGFNWAGVFWAGFLLPTLALGSTNQTELADATIRIGLENIVL